MTNGPHARHPDKEPEEARAGARAAQTDAVQLRVRRAVVSDARAVATIAVMGWRAAYRGILPDGYLDRLSVDARERAWRAMLETDEPEGMPAWIAERGAARLGFVSSGPPRDEDLPPGSAEVFAIYVLPEAWRGGVGRALLRTAAEYWLARGAPAIVLWVLEENGGARSFYEAMGWRPDGGRQLIQIGEVSVTEVRYRLGERPAEPTDEES